METIEGTLKLKEKENIIEFQLLRVGRENENENDNNDVDDGDDGDDENDSENN